VCVRLYGRYLKQSPKNIEPMAAEIFSQFNTLFTQLLPNKFHNNGKFYIDPNKIKVENFILIRDYNHLGLSTQNRAKETILGMNIAFLTGGEIDKNKIFNTERWDFSYGWEKKNH